MPRLKVTIHSEIGKLTGSYTIECVNRPGIDVETYDSTYTINLIRAIAERHRYQADFDAPPPLTLMSVSSTVPPPSTGPANPVSVNDLWFEIENLLLGCRLNFATSRTLKDLELEQDVSTPAGFNANRDLHLEKMERFHLGVFELARIEDMIVRLLYEYFGYGFIEVDTNRADWEKKLTWGEMMASLNARGNSAKTPHSRLSAMSASDYDRLMNILRQYKSKVEVMRLINYRDARMHRPSPSVDYSDMPISIPPPQDPAGVATFYPSTSPIRPEHSFIKLYDSAKKVYAHLLKLLLQLNEIVHA